MNVTGLTWVLQANVLGQSDIESLSSSIRTRGMRLETLRIVPFSHEPADPMPEIDGPCIVYGSSGLLALARGVGWLPAGWDGVNFEADVVRKRLGRYALNSAGLRASWSNVADVARSRGWQRVFVRPDSETKEFPGRVFALPDLEDWIQKLGQADYFADNDNAVVVGPALELGREWRVFVVSDEQVSTCQYADQGVSRQLPGGPEHVAEFVTGVTGVYRPAPCFVVDVAEVMEDGNRKLRVVEFNSINSAGFYLCDIDKIVDRVSAFVR